MNDEKLKLREEIDYLKRYYKQSLFYKFRNSKDDILFKFLYYLRKEEYYSSSNNVFSKVLYYVYKIRKNKIGTSHGIEICAGSLGYGSVISHLGNIVINGKSKIGTNCQIVGPLLLGSNDSGFPVVGNNCILGYGSMIVGGVKVGDNSIVGAGAVVTKSFAHNSVIAGVPAKLIRINSKGK